MSASPDSIWSQISPYFQPPAEYVDDLGDFRSVLQFDDGSPIETAGDWVRRRKELLSFWHERFGAWPPVIKDPTVEILSDERRDDFQQLKVRVPIAPDHTTEGYLLVPDGDGPKPGVVVVYYEPETGIGLNAELRDFAYQLTRRGFVSLSIGLGGSFYYPSKEDAQLQPLSALAYVAANGYHVLASRDDVDPERIGVTGHSYGGKWAMFASCLYEKFAASVWSDGGIVFDESRPNVNYWEPWYIGYEQGVPRESGVPSDEKPRTGPYRDLVAEGRDLHELMALHAPRPLLVSGGSEDPPERWKALNHVINVNRLLGIENRVAMTNRPKHTPTEESNEILYLFFEYFLKHGKALE
jgi:dienelactone hydrolase